MFQQLDGGVSVCMRQVRGGGGFNVRRVQQAITRGAGAMLGDVHDAANTAWGFMGQVRGTSAYWSKAKGDVFAITALRGQATWFITFSADDMGWADLMVKLGKLEGRQLNTPEEQLAFLDGLSKDDMQQLFLRHQVSL